MRASLSLSRSRSLAGWLVWSSSAFRGPARPDPSSSCPPLRAPFLRKRATRRGRQEETKRPGKDPDATRPVRPAVCLSPYQHFPVGRSVGRSFVAPLPPKNQASKNQDAQPHQHRVAAPASLSRGLSTRLSKKGHHLTNNARVWPRVSSLSPPEPALPTMYKTLPPLLRSAVSLP